MCSYYSSYVCATQHKCAITLPLCCAIIPSSYLCNVQKLFIYLFSFYTYLFIEVSMSITLFFFICVFNGVMLVISFCSTSLMSLLDDNKRNLESWAHAHWYRSVIGRYWPVTKLIYWSSPHQLPSRFDEWYTKLKQDKIVFSLLRQKFICFPC